MSTPFAGRPPSNRKLAVAITAALPVLLSVYQEGIKRHERTQEQSQQAQALAEQQAKSEEEADAATAQSLSVAFENAIAKDGRRPHKTGQAGAVTASGQGAASQAAGAGAPASAGASVADTGANTFCSTYYFAAAQLLASPRGDQTLAALEAAMDLHTQVDLAPVICECSAQIEDLKKLSYARPRSLGASRLGRGSEQEKLIEEMGQHIKDTSQACATFQHNGAANVGNVAAPLPVPESRPARHMAGRPHALAMSAPAPQCTFPAMTAVNEADIDLGTLIYVQVPGRDFAGSYNALASSLKAEGWNGVAAMEVVGRNAPDTSQVRYVYDEDQGTANYLAHWLSSGDSLCRLGPTVTPTPMPQYQGKVAPGVIEIWFARPAPAAASSAVPAPAASPALPPAPTPGGGQP